MTYYQLIYLIPATLEPDEIEKIQNKVRDILSQSEAIIIKEFEPEKKKLSYPIKQVRHGIYLKIHFNIKQNQLTSVQKKLRLTTNLLRFILTKEKPTKKKIKVKIRPALPQSATKKPSEIATKEEITKKESRKKPEISLEELDKKLDEILDN